MFFFKKWSIAKEDAAKTAAIRKSQAVIELGLDGTVITANENYLNIFGYTLANVRGQHHSMFVEADERSGAGYRDFWARLNKGETQSAEFKRIDRHGDEVWVQASYIPVLDSRGNPKKVIALAADITAKKITELANAGQVSAIERAQAVVEFNLDGTIITANKNFLNVMGYTLGEMQGKHDRVFVESSERAGDAYRDFWARLNRGEAQSAEYKRIGKDGKLVWLQASYNPVLDSKGKPVKVVEIATDITARKLKALENEGQLAALERAQAIASFRPDGTIIAANDKYLKAMGYTLGEVSGKHDGMFVESSERSGSAYRDFWTRLNRGEAQSAEYKRIAKDGSEVRIRASYIPVLDAKGKTTKVVQYATVIESAAAASEDMSASVQEAPVSMAEKADEQSLSMNRLENRRKTVKAGPSPFAQFLTNLREGFSSAVASSTRAVANFL